MGLPVPRWGELARASAHRPQTRANAGRLRGAARRQPPTAGFSAQPRRESSRLGRAARRPLPPRAGRRKFATDRHRRLPRFSRRHSDRLSTRAASALLGPQDAQSSRARAPPRFSRREKQRAGHLSGCRLRCRRPGVSRLPSALAGSLSRSGAQARTGLARVAGLFSDAAAPVAQTAHHQRHRTLLRGSAPPHPPHGLLRQRTQRRKHHLRHLPSLQRAMEKPHPPPFYTSCLTSPFPNFSFTSIPSRAILPSGMISFTAKRITSKSSMSITSTTTKKTISASGVWRNS